MIVRSLCILLFGLAVGPAAAQAPAVGFGIHAGVLVIDTRTHEVTKEVTGILVETGRPHVMVSDPAMHRLYAFGNDQFWVIGCRASYPE